MILLVFIGLAFILAFLSSKCFEAVKLQFNTLLLSHQSQYHFNTILNQLEFCLHTYMNNHL
jgi:hypothetical protein